MVQITETPTGRETMLLNVGPQHPATHGVLRLLVELDGETVVSCTPDIGFLHTGIEKEMESRNYYQAIVLTDRTDYLAPLSNNLSYILSVEKLFGVTDQVPRRAQYMRVLLSELTRIASHLVWLGTHAMDLGATTVFLYCFRERELILSLFEELSGVRMMTSFYRIGGLCADVPDGWFDHVRQFLDVFPSRLRDYETLLTRNPIFLDRTRGVATLSADELIQRGVTGPCARPSPTPATTSSTSTSRPARREMSTPATWCGSRRCGRACASAGRRWSGCRADRSGWTTRGSLSLSGRRFIPAWSR